MPWKDQLADFTVAEIVAALGCPASTAYGWKDGRRGKPEWEQPHWLAILRRSKPKVAPAPTRRRVGTGGE